jgi:hypothetical protein
MSEAALQHRLEPRVWGRRAEQIIEALSSSGCVLMLLLGCACFWLQAQDLSSADVVRVL